MKRSSLWEAMYEGSSRIWLKGSGEGTCREIALPPTSALRGPFSPGPQLRAWIHALFLLPLKPTDFQGRENAASLRQIRAALSFAYKYWDVKNP
jgi:hypothetical protein